MSDSSSQVIETTISRAIVENFSAKLLDNLTVDVAIVGAGPSAYAGRRPKGVPTSTSVRSSRQTQNSSKESGSSVWTNSNPWSRSSMCLSQ